MHALILSLFLLLLICVFAWFSLYRETGRGNPGMHPHYRRYQVLIGMIAVLCILLVLLIVFSSDPGDAGDYLWLP